MDRAGFQFALENTKCSASALLAHQSLTAWAITVVVHRCLFYPAKLVLSPVMHVMPPLNEKQDRLGLPSDLDQTTQADF
jgi:hypothetical protein